MVFDFLRFSVRGDLGTLPRNGTVSEYNLGTGGLDIILFRHNNKTSSGLFQCVVNIVSCSGLLSRPFPRLLYDGKSTNKQFIYKHPVDYS